MKPEYLELRIEELEEIKKKLFQKRSEIDKELIRLDGKIEALWEWLDAFKKQGEFGGLEGGKTKVLKVPTIGDASKVAEALENRAKAPTGENAEQAADFRSLKQLQNAQTAVDAMDGRGPFSKTRTFLPPGTEPDALIFQTETSDSD